MKNKDESHRKNIIGKKGQEESQNDPDRIVVEDCEINYKGKYSLAFFREQIRSNMSKWQPGERKR